MKHQELPQNNIETEKQQRLIEISEKVEKTTDKIGKGVEDGIKEAVVALLANEFPTSQSCEGHFSEEGASSPWIEIYAPEPEGWKEDKEKQKEWTIENLKQQKRMIDLFAEFYHDREAPFDARLNFRNIGAFGGFRIQSMGSETIPLLSPEEQKQKLITYRKEMAEFTDFLKRRFFER